MTRAGPDAGPDHLVDVRCARWSVDEIADVLLGAQPDHHAQAVALRHVEQGAGRHGMRNPDGVDPAGGHLREVPFHLREIVIFVPVLVRLERAVGHAAHVELLFADEKELAADTGPLGGWRGGRPRAGHAGCRPGLLLQQSVTRVSDHRRHVRIHATHICWRRRM